MTGALCAYRMRASEEVICRDPEKEIREVVVCSVRQQQFLKPFGSKSPQGVEEVAGLPVPSFGVNRTPRADVFSRSEDVVLEPVE